ncbi:RusA family crossover junction endodeoxyribonuclease [Bradyrhizobium japonicum]|uniref:RusA family crossover junction endodeoxyribonuclease n=1 Tax=Bradyrhizobium japonicum TaxID=375 RepID=UPI001BA58BF3|nr:RusA family crossover junction endodeoxyribonuclease [Bradyrhizobium japonicum]MBR0957427.1 RusA family crossover junction endodeoxyribonuclease [Bradyrhizobium japonicum]
MEMAFPIEFLVHGTPVSSQAKSAIAREDWKARVKTASFGALPHPHFVSDQRMAVTLYYLPEGRMPGDIDNIVKLVLDALCAHIYLDDAQVERVVVQKFEPGNVFGFSNGSMTIIDAITAPKPVLYVRVSNDPLEELT